MRWTIIRLIWGRELRDQLRDRRTMFVMVLLPLLIYPLGGVGLMQIVLGSGPKRSVVGISGAEHLPPDIKPAEQSLLDVQLLDSADRAPLDQGIVDLLLVVPADFRSQFDDE